MAEIAEVTITCPACGHPNKPDAAYCWWCEKRLPSTNDNTTTGFLDFIMAFLFPLIGLIVMFIVSARGQKRRASGLLKLVLVSYGLRALAIVAFIAMNLASS